MNGVELWFWCSYIASYIRFYGFCAWVHIRDINYKRLDRADMEKAKDLFYDIFGWDRTTGVPTRETLEKYDLADMADDLEKRGIYAQNTAAAE